MNQNALLNDKQTQLLIETIGKNGWCSADPGVRLDMWSNFPKSPDVLRNYLCKDGSGYIRGYYDGGRYFLCDEISSPR